MNGKKRGSSDKNAVLRVGQVLVLVSASHVGLALTKVVLEVYKRERGTIQRRDEGALHVVERPLPMKAGKRVRALVVLDRVDCIDAKDDSCGFTQPPCNSGEACFASDFGHASRRELSRSGQAVVVVLHSAGTRAFERSLFRRNYGDREWGSCRRLFNVTNKEGGASSTSEHVSRSDRSY